MLVSIRSIYNWDNTIFDELALPDDMDKDLYCNMLMLELAELSIVYSDPETLKYYIRIWSNTRLNTWKRLWDLAMEEYNPLDNYNRYDEETITHGHKIIDDGTNYSKKYVYGFNSENRTHSDDIEADIDNTQTHSGTDRNNRHGHGNIGVTTYQKMLTDEYAIRPKLDMYRYLVEEFKNQFCVTIY